MEFPKSTFVITVDIWFTLADGTKAPSRAVGYSYASSAAEALEVHKADVLSVERAYDWEDVQVLSVMPSADRDMIEYGERAGVAYRNGRWNGI